MSRNTSRVAGAFHCWVWCWCVSGAEETSRGVEALRSWIIDVMYPTGSCVPTTHTHPQHTQINMSCFTMKTLELHAQLQR